MTHIEPSQRANDHLSGGADPTDADPLRVFWFESAVRIDARTSDEAFDKLHVALSKIAADFKIDEALPDPFVN